MINQVKAGSVTIGGDAPLALIAGPCVIESAALADETAEQLGQMAKKLKIGLIFKSSFDKANRSSLSSFRGPGFDEGLAVLAGVKAKYALPVISDIHETWQVKPAAEVLDAIQIPAFLARQTDLLIAAAKSGLPVNVKKGQFMAPEDMAQVVGKMAAQTGFGGLTLCERGASFGYHNLVVDMRSFPIMSSFGWPVIYDATHSVQLPAASGQCSGGDRRFIPTLARAAVAAGVDGVFIETHPRPDKALCDGPNQWPLDRLEELLTSLISLHEAVRPLREEFL
ncbi:MAG: 3-deoxy-8-phosphooctulonate synthase [Candidatus Adiutrix sp.]|jgi:2-dehydro-3-deoxyphosphooctonate aldolase (KDO 8-P synthase)|nr:3-deoxy-8-phosphooctulonate synthase [Candidatus Adiutrix sp.]